MVTKRNSPKSPSQPTKKQPKTAGKLEEIYRQYLAPMPSEQWSQTHDLSQPSLLKQVPTRTAYSTVGAFDA